MALFRDRGAEIEPLGRGRYTVPGCSGGAYTVDLAAFGGEESCNCPDHRRHPEHTCKHLIAATIYRAKASARRRRESEARQRVRQASAAAAFGTAAKFLERMGA